MGDFMNGVCTHIVRLNEHTKKLDYYTGNYDSYVRERSIRDDEQQRKYDAEQRDIAGLRTSSRGSATARSRWSARPSPARSSSRRSSRRASRRSRSATRSGTSRSLILASYLLQY